MLGSIGSDVVSKWWLGVGIHDRTGISANNLELWYTFCFIDDD
jgi:hypothetical protein